MYVFSLIELELRLKRSHDFVAIHLGFDSQIPCEHLARLRDHDLTRQVEVLLVPHHDGRSLHHDFALRHVGVLDGFVVDRIYLHLNRGILTEGGQKILLVLEFAHHYNP